MSKDRKLDERVRSRPKDLRFDEMRRFLEINGFVLMRKSGSHRIFRGDGRRVTIASPHGKANNSFIPVYQFDEAIEAVDASEE